MGSSTNKMLKPYHFDHLKGPNNSLIWFFSKRHRFWKLILILFIFIVCFLLHQRYSFYKIKPLLTINKYEDLQFHESKNETGFDEFIVPDIVHYVQLENPYLEFITLISILSVLKHHKPSLIMIHSDQKQLKGKYWDKLNQMNSNETNTVIELSHVKRPVYIFDKKISSVYHASDIVRLEALKKYGGIYIDNDMYIVKSLHYFRKFEFVIGWPEDAFLGNQVIIAHKNARFLNLWYDSYKNYKPNLWYYNAGELPTKQFLEKSPDLVHRVKTEFGVHLLVQMLYKRLDTNWQQNYYAIHLLSRHLYLIDERNRTFDEQNIGNYNCTFGEMARLVYFGSKSLRL